MAFMGADTDALREAGQECQEGKEKTDQVIQYLRMLIMALRAASFFTGGASAAYAEYLETTVVPWLQRISQALGLMAQVLLSNADDQDGVSDSGTQISGSGTALSYSSPSASTPMQPIGVWEGSLVPAAVAPGTTSETGSSFGSLGGLPAGSGPGVTAVTSTEGTGGLIGATTDSSGSWATNDHVGDFGQTALGGSPAPGSWDGSSSIGAPTIAPTGSSGGLDGGAIGGGTGGSTGGATGGGSGSSGLGSSSIGGTPDAGSDTSGTGLSSYGNDSLLGIGGGTPDSGANVGDAGLGAPTVGAVSGDGSSYGAVAGVAGGAAADGRAHV